MIKQVLQFRCWPGTVYACAHVVQKALFFLIHGLRIFFQNIKVGGGKKIKIRITTIFFFISSEAYLDRRKKNNKNCMILHCKKSRKDNNIVISAFLQCKIIHFLLFFFNIYLFFF